MKELHEITGEGKMGQCDIYPRYSIQVVNPKDGVRWTKEGRDAIHPDIGSRKLELLPNEEILLLENSRKCDSCGNIFTEKGEFHTENECIRCHKRKTEPSKL